MHVMRESQYRGTDKRVASRLNRNKKWDISKKDRIETIKENRHNNRKEA